jgi:hypothetical protein
MGHLAVLVDTRIDAAHLPGIRAARVSARARAWAAGAAPAAGCTSVLMHDHDRSLR